MGFAVESVPALTVFFQGLISFFSPCVLPLVPLYVSYLAGGARVVGEDGVSRYPRRKVMVNTLFFVVGISFTDKDADKKALLERAFALAGLDGDARRSALMVGDRCFDIDGANDTGIDSLGVLYGFGSREELEGHGATLLAASASEIVTLLLE
jgi:hypothetical protein